MSVVGVIAEYNPFHPGHAHQLREARRMSGADCVAVVMSSCFVQRGEAAVLSPAVRARMALTQGADIVFALPACWAVRDAEHFALGGVHLLQLIGADAISFGAETADLPLMQRSAALMENTDALAPAIRTRMDAGMAYPAALAEATETAVPGAGRLLSSPNNTLAVCYLRALMRLGSSMRICPVHRQTDYHATAVEAIPSATALRGALFRGDWYTLRTAISAESYALLRQEAVQGRVHRPDALDQALAYRLRTMSPEEWNALPDLSEGIDDRLRKAALLSASREAILQSAKTRRYPYARLSRLCTHALLGITQAQLQQEPLPDALWLLGFGPAALPLLRSLKQRGVSVISKAAAADNASDWFRTELRAYDLWALGCGLPAGLALQQGVVRV